MSKKEKKEARTEMPKTEETEIAEEIVEAEQKTAAEDAEEVENADAAPDLQTQLEEAKRNATVRADAYADGRRDVATAMLQVLDNLERAVNAAADSPDDALKSGMELVLKQMSEVYQKLEVTPIDRQGEKFDPNLENAVLQGTPEEGEPGTVCQVLQKGYRMGEKVLRHAMVKVVPE